MKSLKEGLNRVLAVLGLVTLGVIGVALLGAGLVVGLAAVALFAIAYAAMKVFGKPLFKGRIQTYRIASCQSCGRITDQRVCECGTRV